MDLTPCYLCGIGWHSCTYRARHTENVKGHSDIGIGANNQKLSSSGAITDGPDQTVYGVNACQAANEASQSLLGSTSTLSYAEPYVILAKGMSIFSCDLGLPSNFSHAYTTIFIRVLPWTEEERFWRRPQWTSILGYGSSGFKDVRAHWTSSGSKETNLVCGIIWSSKPRLLPLDILHKIRSTSGPCLPMFIRILFSCMIIGASLPSDSLKISSLSSYDLRLKLLLLSHNFALWLSLYILSLSVNVHKLDRGAGLNVFELGISQPFFIYIPQSLRSFVTHR